MSQLRCSWDMPGGPKPTHHRDTAYRVYCYIADRSWEMQSTQTFMDRLEKESAAHGLNGILCNQKEIWNHEGHGKMDVTGRQYATQTSQIKREILHALYAKPRVKFMYVSLHMCVSVCVVRRS